MCGSQRDLVQMCFNRIQILWQTHHFSTQMEEMMCNLFKNNPVYQMIEMLSLVLRKYFLLPSTNFPIISVFGVNLPISFSITPQSLWQNNWVTLLKSQLWSLQCKHHSHCKRQGGRLLDNAAVGRVAAQHLLKMWPCSLVKKPSHKSSKFK